MTLIKRKFIDFIKKTNVVKKINYNKFVFHFLFDLKNQHGEFKVNINTKCLVLSQYPGAETKGLGGLIAQHPKNFEVLCLTNGSNIEPRLGPLDSASLKKQQFQSVMKMIRIKGSKVFDIDSGTLKNHYSTFKKIDISEADYIFIPNVYDNNIDTIALIEHFRQILKDKEFKETLKIIMYESDYPLCAVDYYVNISPIIGTKKKMLEQYYCNYNYPNMVERLIGINAFRSMQYPKTEYCEVFMCFSVDEFLKIPMV